MLRFILCCGLAVPFVLLAQFWCPPGATWKWNTTSFGSEGSVQRHYVGDSLIGGRTAQIIHVTGTNYTTFPELDTIVIDHYRYTALDNDVVLLWNIWNGPPVWDTLYWFGAVPGDRWYAPGDDGECGPTPAGMHQVMDTTTVLINGLPMKELTLSAVDVFGSPFGDQFTLTERIGLANGTFNLFSGCIAVGSYETLLCYSDNSIDLVTPEGEFGCNSLVGITTLGIPDELLVFPNPGSDQLTIHLPHGNNTIELLDNAGRMVHHRTSSQRKTEIDTSSLAQGTYLVITTNRTGERSFTRWVKH